MSQASRESCSTSRPLSTGQEIHKDWVQYCNAPNLDPETYFQTTLRKHYPNHSLKAIRYLNILSFPQAIVDILPDVPKISSSQFLPLPRTGGTEAGVLGEAITFGGYTVLWEGLNFLVYAISWIEGFGRASEQIILHEGAPAVIDKLIIAAGGWENLPHQEILVFDQSLWHKDHDLWLEVQKADWGDIILKEEFKSEFRSDIEGFFESEEVYKKYGLPWKRGIIMHGPPGNGKTISLKAIMKYSQYPCLYVKTFKTWLGVEGSMATVFNRARQMAPCILVLEDLDTLVDTETRSFFLNQVDGLTGNDGLLLLSTTNYLDRIDDSLSKRPSRFDRKYLFDDPDLEERKLYSKYWQNKLKSNDEIAFPDSLMDKIADATDGFSFAYLKEAFVSSLVLLADEAKGKSLEEVIMEQIEVLRKGLGDGAFQLV